MPSKPELLGVANKIAGTTAAPSLATDGFDTKRHRFIHVWVKHNSATNFASYQYGVYLRVWYYRTGIGWVAAEMDPVFISQSQLGTGMFLLEPRGSPERIYLQTTKLVSATEITRLCVEGVTYDGSDTTGAAPERLYSALGINSANTSLGGTPFANSTNGAIGFATNGHRFVNVWSQATDPVNPAFSHFRPNQNGYAWSSNFGWWAFMRDMPQALVATTTLGGRFQQFEVRGVERLFILSSTYVQETGVTVTTLLNNSIIDGVTYGD